MADFHVKIKQMIKQQEELAAAAGELERLSEEIGKVKSALSFEIASKQNILKKLNGIQQENQENGHKVLVMKEKLEEAAGRYEQSEGRVIDNLSAGGEAAETENGGYAGAIAGAALGAAAGITLSDDWKRKLQDLIHGRKVQDALLAGEDSFKIGGITAGFAGGVLGYEADLKKEAFWDLAEGEAGIGIEAELELYGAKGSVSVKKGPCSLETGAMLGYAGVKASGKGVLFQDGKFDPKLELEGSIEAAAAKTKVETRVGTENLAYTQKMEGSFLGTEAKAKLEFDPKNGALSAEAGAEAYLLKGEITQGFEIFGIEFNGKVEGKAGALGATAKAGFSDKSATIGAGVSALLGVDIELSVDWSNFKMPSWKDIKFW